MNIINDESQKTNSPIIFDGRLKTKNNGRNFPIKQSNYHILFEEEFGFRTVLQIKPENRNYNIFKSLGYHLHLNKRSWQWLFNESQIPVSTWKFYLAGRENVSLFNIESLTSLMPNTIRSPRQIMDNNYPTLRGSDNVRLNIREILEKYRINRVEIVRETGIPQSALGRYMSGYTTQVRGETLYIFYEFFKTKGVPLKGILDLIYFPNYGEQPLHFLENPPHHVVLPTISRNKYKGRRGFKGRNMMNYDERKG